MQKNDKKISLTMKIDQDIASTILEEYESQRFDDESGTPFKGDFIGNLFMASLKKVDEAESKGISSSPDMELMDRYEKARVRLKWFKIITLLSISFVIVLIIMYRKKNSL
jgi:hypothetical protein